MDLVQEMGHGNIGIIQERDDAQKKVEELREKLIQALKEKNEANKMAHEACEEMVRLRREGCSDFEGPGRQCQN